MEKIIELKDVVRTYKLGDETLHALNHVSLSVNKGEFVAITGPSGSGKSTLANIIGGLDTPTSGNVVVDQQDLSKIGDNRLSAYRNNYIGFVFQSFNLQARNTALENVALPLIFARKSRKQRSDKAKQCLEAVGLSGRIKSRADQLSGGERQRVAIARALANDSKIIIADEPTGNLDSARGSEIMSLLKSLVRSGITLLVITHDMNIARQADRVVEMRDGKLTEHRK